MSKFACLLLIVLSLLLVGSLSAQDFPTNTPPTLVATAQPGGTYAVTSPAEIYPGVPENVFVLIIIVGAALFLALVASFAYLHGQSVRALYKSLPPESQILIRTILEIGLGQAAKTETTVDDASLELLANQLGYLKTVTTDGRIILTPMSQPPPPPGG